MSVLAKPARTSRKKVASEVAGPRKIGPILKHGIAVPKAAGFDAATFLATTGLGKSVVNHERGDTVFSQGDEANSIFYIQKGKIKIGVLSARGRGHGRDFECRRLLRGRLYRKFASAQATYRYSDV